MTRATDDDGEPAPTMPTAVADLTPTWLEHVLRGAPAPPGGESSSARLVDVQAEPLGVGVGLLATLHRLQLTWSDGTGPASVVVKRPVEGGRSRAVAALFDMYRTEVGFYRDLAAGTSVAVPCHHAVADERTGDFLIVMADRSGDVTVDQFGGCPSDRARAVVTALADLHAHHSDGATLTGAPWLRQLDHRDVVAGFQASLRATWPKVRDRHPDVVEPVVELGDRLATTMPALAAALTRPPVTLAHGDARLDNMFFTGREGVMLCDWQLTGVSRGVRDLAYFLTQSLSAEARTMCERPLIDTYLARLADLGIAGSDEDDFQDGYRAATVLGLVYAIIAEGGLDRATPYSAALTEAMLRRSVAAVVDHDGASLG